MAITIIKPTGENASNHTIDAYIKWRQRLSWFLGATEVSLRQGAHENYLSLGKDVFIGNRVQSKGPRWMAWLLVVPALFIFPIAAIMTRILRKKVKAEAKKVDAMSTYMLALENETKTGLNAIISDLETIASRPIPVPSAPSESDDDTSSEISADTVIVHLDADSDLASEIDVQAEKKEAAFDLLAGELCDQALREAKEELQLEEAQAARDLKDSLQSQLVSEANITSINEPSSSRIPVRQAVQESRAEKEAALDQLALELRDQALSQAKEELQLEEAQAVRGLKDSLQSQIAREANIPSINEPTQSRIPVSQSVQESRAEKEMALAQAASELTNQALRRVTEKLQLEEAQAVQGLKDSLQSQLVSEANIPSINEPTQSQIPVSQSVQESRAEKIGESKDDIEGFLSRAPEGRLISRRPRGVTFKSELEEIKFFDRNEIIDKSQSLKVALQENISQLEKVTSIQVSARNSKLPLPSYLLPQSDAPTLERTSSEEAHAAFLEKEAEELREFLALEKEAEALTEFLALEEEVNFLSTFSAKGSGAEERIENEQMPESDSDISLEMLEKFMSKKKDLIHDNTDEGLEALLFDESASDDSTLSEGELSESLLIDEDALSLNTVLFGDDDSESVISDTSSEHEGTLYELLFGKNTELEHSDALSSDRITALICDFYAEQSRKQSQREASERACRQAQADRFEAIVKQTEQLKAQAPVVSYQQLGKRWFLFLDEKPVSLIRSVSGKTSGIVATDFEGIPSYRISEVPLSKLHEGRLKDMGILINDEVIVDIKDKSQILFVFEGAAPAYQEGRNYLEAMSDAMMHKMNESLAEIDDLSHGTSFLPQQVSTASRQETQSSSDAVALDDKKNSYRTGRL